MQLQVLTTEYLQECRAALSAEQARSLADTGNWAHVNREQVHADWDELYKEMAGLVNSQPPSAPEVQALIAKHYGIACRFYVPSKRAYIGVSLFYGEDAAMKRFHDAYHPGLVDFLAQAIPLYAQKQL